MRTSVILSRSLVVGVLGVIAVFFAYISLHFFPWSYYAAGIVLAIFGGIGFLLNQLATQTATGGDLYTAVKNLVGKSTPPWRRLLNYTKVALVIISIIIAWPVFLGGMSVGMLLSWKIWARITQLPAILRGPAAASSYLGMHIGLCSFTALIPLLSYTIFVGQQTHQPHLPLSVFISFNMLVFLTLVYAGYLADLGPLQRRFRRSDMNVYGTFGLIFVANAAAILLSAYVVFLWETGTMASSEAFRHSVLRVLAYRQFWNPSHWPDTTLGALITAASTTGFYLSIFGSLQRLGEFKRTSEDWISIAHIRIASGRPELAVKALTHVDNQNVAAKQIRAAALINMERPDEAWSEIEIMSVLLTPSSPNDPDLTFWIYSTTVVIYTNTSDVTMKAANFSLSKGISDGRAANFVSMLCEMGLFDSELLNVDLQRYPLIANVLWQYERKKGNAEAIHENLIGVSTGPQKIQKIGADTDWSSANDSVDMAVGDFIAILNRRSEYNSETEFLSTVDSWVEPYTHYVERSISKSGFVGTKVLLVRQLIVVLAFCKMTGVAYEKRLSGIIDGLLNELRSSLSNSEYLNQVIEAMKFGKDQISRISI